MSKEKERVVRSASRGSESRKGVRVENECKLRRSKTRE